MSVIKTSSLVLSAAAVAILAVVPADAMVAKKKQAPATQTVQSTLTDNNAPKTSLDARAFFERIANEAQ